MKRGMILAAVLGLIVALAALAVVRAVDAKRPKGTDLDQLKQMLYEGERAAEQRNPGGITKFISDKYQDELFNADRARYAIRDWLRRQGSIELDIPSDSVRFEPGPDGKTGTLQFMLTFVRRAEGAATPAGFPITLQVVKEPVHYYGVFPGEEWRITGAGGYQGLEE